MIARARAGTEIRVPASPGDHAELRVQDRFTVAAIASGETHAVWGAAATSGLHWGRRGVIHGEIWINKTRHALELSR